MDTSPAAADPWRMRAPDYMVAVARDQRQSQSRGHYFNLSASRVNYTPPPRTPGISRKLAATLSGEPPASSIGNALVTQDRRRPGTLGGLVPAWPNVSSGSHVGPDFLTPSAAGLARTDRISSASASLFATRRYAGAGFSAGFGQRGPQDTDGSNRHRPPVVPLESRIIPSYLGVAVRAGRPLGVPGDSPGWLLPRQNRDGPRSSPMPLDSHGPWTDPNIPLSVSGHRHRQSLGSPTIRSGTGERDRPAGGTRDRSSLLDWPERPPAGHDRFSMPDDAAAESGNQKTGTQISGELWIDGIALREWMEDNMNSLTTLSDLLNSLR